MPFRAVFARYGNDGYTLFSPPYPLSSLFPFTGAAAHTVAIPYDTFDTLRGLGSFFNKYTIPRR
jgi:hypothetical protein